MTMNRCTAGMVIRGLALALVGVGLDTLPAHAQGSSGARTAGAQITRRDECATVDGWRSCLTMRDIFHRTVTPAGLVLWGVNGTFSYSVAAPSGEIVQAVTTDYHLQQLTADGLVRELRNRQWSEFITGSGQRCRLTLAYHQANASIQYDGVETVCTPA